MKWNYERHFPLYKNHTIWEKIQNYKDRNRTVYFGTKIISLLAPRIRRLLPRDIRNASYLEIFNEKIKTLCSYHVTYTFQSEFTLYSCLNVKELFARNRRDIWRLSDSNGTRTYYNYLVRKQTPSGCGFESRCSHR